MNASWVLGPVGIKKGQMVPTQMAARVTTWLDGLMVFCRKTTPELAPACCGEVS